MQPPPPILQSGGGDNGPISPLAIILYLMDSANGEVLSFPNTVGAYSSVIDNMPSCRNIVYCLVEKGYFFTNE